MTFTVSAEPTYIVSDGATYYDGAGYSYAALTVTMTVPPSISFIWRNHIPTVCLGVTFAVVRTYGCSDGRNGANSLRIN